MPNDQSRIRNFSIIAHIDHGKTTLTDAFLRTIQTKSRFKIKNRILDSNPIEQEKGITIKLAPVTLNYKSKKNNTIYKLNLIDTPGHVDFHYEVSRSLAACEGAILLIDATQGIQAQTLANFHKAIDLGLKIIPVINKIDLPSADIDAVSLECMETLNLDEQDILLTSAKTYQGVDKVLEAVIERIPAPSGKRKKHLRASIITSVFDNHQGVIAYVRVIDGVLKKENLILMSNQTKFTPSEIGFFNPDRQACEQLQTGEVGYIATGLKEIQNIRIGDTITNTKSNKIKPLPGFKEPKPVVFLEIYPVDQKDFKSLEDAVSKLTLHDSSLVYSAASSMALGNGLKIGFLGIFHAEIVRERLKREFNLDLIATAPNVEYKIKLKHEEDEIFIDSPSDMPDPSEIEYIKEPLSEVTIFSPSEYYGSIMQLVRSKRGELQKLKKIGERFCLTYQIPFSELITDFHDQLKSLSSGFASLEYKLIDFRKVNAVKVDILIAHEPIEALSFICPEEKAEEKSRAIVKRLKEVVPRQQFEVAVQAAIGGKIIARETIRAYRKDVTAKLYGGDVTRRMKLLRKQAKGKKKLKQIGKVELNQDAFLAILKT